MIIWFYLFLTRARLDHTIDIQIITYQIFTFPLIVRFVASTWLSSKQGGAQNPLPLPTGNWSNWLKSNFSVTHFFFQTLTTTEGVSTRIANSIVAAGLRDPPPTFSTHHQRFWPTINDFDPSPTVSTTTNHFDRFDPSTICFDRFDHHNLFGRPVNSAVGSFS